MYAQIAATILVGTVVLALGGCTPISEPWDSTGYFEKERAHSEALQEQLRHRLAHTQDRL